MNWKVKDFLEEHDLNTFALVNKTHGKLSHNTVYSLARGEPKRIALETLEEVITALRDMTGKPVGIQDLLEYTPEPNRSEEQPPTALALAGIIEDPDSPGDVSARHDDYLGEQLDEKHRVEAAH